MPSCTCFLLNFPPQCSPEKPSITALHSQIEANATQRDKSPRIAAYTPKSRVRQVGSHMLGIHGRAPHPKGFIWDCGCTATCLRQLFLSFLLLRLTALHVLPTQHSPELLCSGLANDRGFFTCLPLFAAHIPFSLGG